MRDAGVDASPTMVRLAVGHENPEPAVLADAAALPTRANGAGSGSRCSCTSAR